VHYRQNGKPCFGADVENFYSAHNYSVYKPNGKVLEYIVNFREGRNPGQERSGPPRLCAGSASRRADQGAEVPIYVSALDFVGKRTALFWNDTNGKVKHGQKILEAVKDLSDKGVSFNEQPLKPIGQIIFDVNGEYANANQQDEGTAIFEMFEKDTTRYSLMEKPGFQVMKLNFYSDVVAGFGLLQSFLGDDSADYVRSFLSIDLSDVEDDDPSAKTLCPSQAAYKHAYIRRALFRMESKVSGNKDINAIAEMSIHLRASATRLRGLVHSHMGFVRLAPFSCMPGRRTVGANGRR
jgi:hypothetical protein